METQLVRLDAPYNIICNKKGIFALHIATLIVVKERIAGVVEGAPMSDTLSVASYPVVISKGDVGGFVWMNTELKDCFLLCSENSKQLHLLQIKRVMEYCAKHLDTSFYQLIPARLAWIMLDYDLRIQWPLDANNKPIADFVVSLEFEEGNDGNTCMAYADLRSPFYFYEYFANVPELFGPMPTNLEATEEMGRLRDIYLKLFHSDGLRSITFTTDNKKYQWFVDKLNGRADGEKV